MASKAVVWTKLKDPPSSMPNGQITSIAPNKFILASLWIPSMHDSKKVTPGLYIFDGHRHEWNLWLRYPSEWEEVWGHTIMFDSTRNELYLWHGVELFKPNKFQKIHITTKQYETIAEVAVKFNAVERKAVNLPDEIHCFGGKSNRHIKFNKDTEKFQEIHRFASFDRIYCSFLVYIDSKQVILAFYAKDGFGVREFSLESQKWRQIEDIEYNYNGGYALLTRDEKHIILVPRTDKSKNRVDVILIMDVLNDGGYKLRKSNICIPKSPAERRQDSDISMVLLRNGGGDSNQLLVNGFVKEVFRGDEWMIVSDDVINLIIKFYEYEMLHVILSDTRKCVNNHWIIDVSSVLH